MGVDKDFSKIFLSVLYIIFTVSGLIVMKIGSNAANGNKSLVIPYLNLNLSIVSLVGILLYGISFCLYLGVISNFKLGFIIPLLGGIINIAVLVASVTVLHEQLGVKALLGALIIIIGIVVMNI